MSPVDLDAVRDLRARYARTGSDADRAHLLDQVGPLVAEVAALRAARARDARQIESQALALSANRRTGRAA